MNLAKLPDFSNWLIFTDLDGTLLDHHDYSFTPATPALEQLARLGVPLILNSSKTPAELSAVSAALGIETTLIAENGSVIENTTTGEREILGSDYSEICHFLDQLRSTSQFMFSGFHDWSTGEVSQATGLSMAAAKQAKQRLATEPILWQDTDERLTEFERLLSQRRLQLKKGGRFYHVMGNTDKVKAMHIIADQHQGNKGGFPYIIALGDGPNDRDMLAAADVAIVVDNPDSDTFELPDNSDQIRIFTDKPGPAGWNDAILSLLKQIS